MGQFDLLGYVIRILEKLGLRYFVTGSTATIFYGEPRFTNDIDIVVDLPESKAIEFSREFPSEHFYLSEEAILDAVRRKTQFNIIHPESGLKMDVMIPDATAFNLSRFSRIRRVHVGQNLDANFASPEDAIIKKMEYYSEGGSEKHLRDITGVLKANPGQIDLAYINQWAARLGLNEIWAAIQAKIA